MDITLKALLAALMAAAVAIGLALPIPHKSNAAQLKSQFMAFELGRW